MADTDNQQELSDSMTDVNREELALPPYQDLVIVDKKPTLVGFHKTIERIMATCKLFRDVSRSVVNIYCSGCFYIL